MNLHATRIKAQNVKPFGELWDDSLASKPWEVNDGRKQKHVKNEGGIKTQFFALNCGVINVLIWNFQSVWS